MNLSHFEQITSYIPNNLDLWSAKGFITVNIVLSAVIIFRYFLMVSPFYFFVFDAEAKKKLKKNQVRFEIKNALITTIFFSLGGYFTALFWSSGFSQIYLDFDHHPLFYLPLSFLVYALIHEVYFYFTHRAMHHPKIYKRVHAAHHYSVNLSPWASFSFHPWEALVQALFLPLMILLVPIHPTVLLAYLTFMTITAISNHLGLELIPSALIKKHFISYDHHSLHHKKFRGNYGLYFCFMDRLMNTELKPNHKKEFL